MSLWSAAQQIASTVVDNLQIHNPGVNDLAYDVGQQYVKGLPIVGTRTNQDDIKVTNDNELDGELLFRVPDWGYQDFIRERTSWQKGFDSATGEPGWFYFKIFFRFDTGEGLLGGLLAEENDQGTVLPKTGNNFLNCAYRYLNMNANHYSKIDMAGRATALQKFGAILSFINGHAPWFFDSISGLDKATVPDLSKPLSDNNVIELGFKEDAIDMRVSTLIDLYKYAAFDYINMKEVLPQNLRQFNMSVVIFHTPIRWYHTGMQTMKRGTFQYKNLSDDDFSNRMTYKLYTFKGCEFVASSLGSVYPAEMSNQQPFNLGNAKVQISYKRVYQHTFNEWGQFMIGDDGVYYDEPSGNSKRLAAIKDAHDNPFYRNPGAEIFKPLVDATEARITWAMRQINPSAVFGNLYLDYTDTNKGYYKEKTKEFKKGAKSLRTSSNRGR